MISALGRFVPPWAVWMAAAALAAMLGVSVLQNAHLRAKLADERAGRAHDIATIEAARASAETRARQVEQELRDAQDTHARETAVLRDDLDRTRERAAVAARGVRSAAQAAADAARAQCATAAAAGLRPATEGDPIGVLADVLGRADRRAGELAEIADRRLLGWNACAREYDAARDTLRRSAASVP